VRKGRRKAANIQYFQNRKINQKVKGTKMLSRQMVLFLLWIETGALLLLAADRLKHPSILSKPPLSAIVTAPTSPNCAVPLFPVPRPSPLSPAPPKRTWKLAFVRDNNIWTANGDSSAPRLLIRKGDSPRWSPDHKQIAFVRANNIWVAQADGTNVRRLTEQWQSPHSDDYSESGVAGLAWNPVDHTILFGHHETMLVKRQTSVPAHDGSKEMTVDAISLFAVSAASKAYFETLYDITEQGTWYGFTHQEQPTFSRSGKYLAFARNGDVWIAKRGDWREGLFYKSGEWNAWQWDVSRLASLASFDDPNWHGSRENVAVTGLSLSPNANYLAYALHRLDGSGTAEIHLLPLSVDNGVLKAGTDREISTDNASDPCMSPDGQWVTYTRFGWGAPADVRGIWITSCDGRISRRLIPDAEQPAW
jgi:hypothetical protein